MNHENFTVKEEVVDLEDLILPPNKQEINCNDLDIKNELSKAIEDANSFETVLGKSHQLKELFCELCQLQFDKKSVYDIHNSIVHKIKMISKVNQKKGRNISNAQFVMLILRERIT